MAPGQEHMIPEVSDRGFRHMPAVPGTYAGQPAGRVEVYESSAAGETALWLKVTDSAGVTTVVHLLLADAVRLAEQLAYLAVTH